jgi:penicillin amidase
MFSKQKKKYLFLSFISVFLIISVTIGTAWAAQKHQKVAIYRDNYGVPHVYAKDTYGIYYGFGYAIATDRLFQMEMAKRSVLGTVSEILGSAYINFDKGIRSNYSPESIQQQYQSLSKKDKDIFDGYAAGMNTRIEEVLAHPGTLLPKQFTDYGFLPAPWTPVDVIMIFVGTMCNRFSDFNTELDNMDFLTYLEGLYGADTAWKIFNQTKWVNDPGAPVTIPDEDLHIVRGLNSGNGFAKRVLPKTKNVIQVVEAKRERTVEETRFLEKIGLGFLNEPVLTSNIWLVGKKRTYNPHQGNAILMNGPQFGWFNPGYVYEIGLHGAGFDLVGSTPFGYPVLLFAHNKHIAWGSTAALGDLIDVYEEMLNPDNPYQYWFNGEWRDMEKRTETVYVKGGDPATVDIYRTVHGFVIRFDTVNHLAYSKKRTWEGHEIESLLTWIESTKAENYWQWRNTAKKMALTINWYYADQKGNIGYIYTGKYPLRKENHDWRLPVSGKGDMEWLGILPFDHNPQVYNPKQGYITNWNNKPASYWNDGDMWWLAWGNVDRVQTIMDELNAKKRFTKDEIWEMNRRLSYIDINIAYFLPSLERAVEGLPSSSAEKQAVLLLKGWDRYRWDLNKDGFYDSPAQTIFQKWLPIMLKNTFQDDFQSFFWMVGSAGYPTTPPSGSTNVQTGVKILYHALLGENSTIPNEYDFFNGVDPFQVVHNSLTETIAALITQYGTSDMSQWKLPVVPQKFFYKNFYGVPQANANEELTLPSNMNRGTENHMVVLKPWEIEGVNVCPPGQSGFVAPGGTEDPHYSDQMGLYENFQAKPMLFYFGDLWANVESVKVLYY